MDYVFSKENKKGDKTQYSNYSIVSFTSIAVEKKKREKNKQKIKLLEAVEK